MLERIEKILNQFRDLSEFARDLTTWITVFGIVVLIYINVKYIISLVRIIRLYFIEQFSSGCCRIDLSQKYGKWAIVTGATQGIGLALARELARQGLSVIIIGRNEEKLARTKASLEQEQNAGEILALKKDFSLSSLESYSELRRQIDPENREIGVLFNNVGIYSLDVKKIAQVEEAYLKETVDVNVLATVLMTRMVLPGMIARGRGLVVNVSSIVGSSMVPYLGVYGGTKQFVNAFSKQLQFEYRKMSNLIIVNLRTGPVIEETRWKGFAKLITCTTEQYAQSVFKVLTKRNHTNEFGGVAKHEYFESVQNFLASLRLLGPMIEYLCLRIGNQVS